KEYLFYRERNALVKEVKKEYFELVYLNLLKIQFLSLDSNFNVIAEASRKYFELGGSGKLEYLTALAKKQEASMRLKQTENDFLAAKTRLHALMQTDSTFEFEVNEYEPLEYTMNDSAVETARRYYEFDNKVAFIRAKAERYKGYPDLHLEYFLGTNKGPDQKLYNGFQVGLGIPIWFVSKLSAAKSMILKAEAVQQQNQNYVVQLASKKEQLILELSNNKAQLDYYSKQGKQLADEIRFAAALSYKSGEINAFQYLLAQENAVRLETEFLHFLHSYNLSVIEINHLSF
ncbi:MAG: TolC family protein, partial [Bacteroidales bacterium]|nr:TolC family protein [Bacteroidales bacterium]